MRKALVLSLLAAAAPWGSAQVVVVDLPGSVALAPLPIAAGPSLGPGLAPSVQLRLSALGSLSPLRPLEAASQARATAAAWPARGLAANEPSPKHERLKVLELRPTQFSAGLKEVENKAAKMKDMKEKELDEYLRDHRVPVVLGPGGAAYIIDHHHLVRAAWEIGLKEVPVEIIGDLSDKTPAAFWKEMQKSGWVYPYDQFGGGPHDPRLLPDTVRGLADDPYRGLAWKVREEGGFKKITVPYSEFLWANFFREHLKTKPVGDDFDAAVKEAVKLAHSPAAKDLPGYIPEP